MNQYFTSLFIILCGGVIPLFFSRTVLSARGISVLFLSLGCFWGSLESIINLMRSLTVEETFIYLKAFPLSFKIDGLSSFFLMVIFSICLLSSFYSYHYMGHEVKKERVATNYFFFSILIVSMALVITASNMLAFMLSWEIMSLSSFFLVIFHHKILENKKAGYLYIVFSHIGAMFILASFSLIYAYTGNIDFRLTSDIPDNIKILIFILSFIGFGLKAGVFPFHVWLPFAHPAAPSHISAVMSGVMIKTGIYGIIRIYTLLNFDSFFPGMLLIAAGTVSGILGVVYALGQHELKRLLAYSSVENIGIILIGLGIGMIGISSKNHVITLLGFTGALFHVLNHSIFKSLLFMGSGMIINITGTSSIDSLGGLLKRMKITGATFLIGSLSISGLPPFNGFAGEFLIYIAGFKCIAPETSVFIPGLFAIASLAIIGGLALACFTKVVGVVLQGEPRTEAAEKASENGASMIFSMSVLASLCFFLGVFPGLVIELPVRALSHLGQGIDPAMMGPALSIIRNISFSAMLFLFVFASIFVFRLMLFRKKAISVSDTWGCGFTQPTSKIQYTASSFASFILEFFKPVAPLTEDHPPIIGRFPKKTYYRSHIHDLVELYMNRLMVDPIMIFFDKLRWIQHGDIHLYIGYILFSIILLLFFIY